MIQLFVVAGLSKCGYMKAHYRQTDRQTHSDRGIGPVLGRLVHYGGTDQYNTIQCNTIQYNTIFLLIKNSLFQDSVTRNQVVQVIL